jgi:hypothetical protein
MILSRLWKEVGMENKDGGISNKSSTGCVQTRDIKISL